MQTVFPIGSKVQHTSGAFTVGEVPAKRVGMDWAHSPDRVWFTSELWGHVSDCTLMDDAPDVDTTPTPSTGSTGGMKYDGGKPRMDLLLTGCPQALTQVAEILTFGAQKYAAHSWQTVPQGSERYLAALLRHLTAHAGGEDKDPESGMSHLAHAACNAMFILELEARNAKGTDTV
ncbi:gp174 [Pectobacterium phage PPWS1]|uniref:Gp174 n=1 Tax=Pectobacterium phage PPWS1 TaxID=1685500 RepID=A0A0P0UWL7_9CAUD|nr:gp174 [Pectobacterium phage PPWS1]BAS69545.1 gp174 [Pectobacterium phage PPWS1]